MALFNYNSKNPGEWVPVNPVRQDDGFGNLIVNNAEQFNMAFRFIEDN